MDRPSGVIEQVEGDEHGAQDQEVAETGDTELEPGDNSNPNGGREDQENGGEVESVEGGVLEEENQPESESKIDLKSIEENILKSIDEKLKANQPAPEQKPLTEEDWERIEGEWGGVPRQAIDRVTRQSVQVFEKMREYVDSKFAAIESESAMSALAKEPGFQDVPRLKAGIKEFLSDFDPKFHTNPGLLKKAAIYARGLISSKDIKAVQSRDERNRQVIRRLKPASNEGGSPKGSGSKGLNDMQREAAALLSGGEAEYQKIKNRSNRIIAA